MFDELIVAIGDNPEKNYTFSHEERMDMLRTALSDMPEVHIAEFHNRFLVDFAKEHEASFMLRGIRSTQDYEYERVMRHINADMAPKVCTVFLDAPARYGGIVLQHDQGPDRAGRLGKPGEPLRSPERVRPAQEEI